MMMVHLHEPSLQAEAMSTCAMTRYETRFRHYRPCVVASHKSQQEANSPVCKVLGRIADDLEGNLFICQAIFGDQVNGSHEGVPCGLVVMEQISPQKYQVYFLLHSQLQNLLKGLEGIIFAKLIFLPDTLHEKKWILQITFGAACA